MTALLDTVPAAAAAVLAAMLLLWLASLARGDASIVDAAWGPAFVLATAAAAGAVPRVGPRGLLALALVSAWALRLAWHLGRRNGRHGEDRRYAAMRAAHGERFWLVSLFTVFLLQGALVVGISLPLQAAVAGPPSPLGALDAAAALLVVAGLALEATADAQLARFVADPASRGRVLDRGLWRFSRHPNYFGEAVLWWGFGLLGAAAGAPWTLAAPALMTFLLLRVSGVTLLERDIAERRPGYRDYVRRTSSFVPWFPRVRGGSPADEPVR